MTVIEIPPARESELHDVPVLVVQLQDDLTRSRLREAFWISVIFHLVLVILAITSPKWVPSFRALPLRSAEQVIQDRQLTYLDLPHDRQKIDKKPNTNTISDKDRVATSRHPSIDRRTLQELRDSARPGPMASTPPQAAAPASPPSPPAQQQAMANPNAGAMTSPFRQQQQQARMQPQAQQPNPFASAPMSPGSAIAQAARGTRIGGGGGGSGGDHGYGQGAPSSSVQSNMDILSDTMGVDFGPYLTRVLHDVRINWYNLIPEVARPPIMKRGKVSIEFVIEKDGRVAGMRVIGPSGDVALDRAAWGGISASNPFPPLPSEFRGPYLALRFHFYYNPEHGELR
jgi:TonB family protein